MAILRCNSCNYIREVANEHIGKTVKCPVCEQAASIHDAAALVKNVLDRYLTLADKYKKLLQRFAPEDVSVSLPASETQDTEIDLHNTSAMTSNMQFKPILKWFERKRPLNHAIDFHNEDWRQFMGL